METKEVLVHYIQEFYEVTLLNSQKTCEQKIQEANQVAEKLERKTFLVSPRENLQKASAELKGFSGSEGNALCDEQNKENQCLENQTDDKKIKQNQGKCPSQNCSVEPPAWMPVHHCTVHITKVKTKAVAALPAGIVCSWSLS
ncbi:uncharacterized protein ACOB8E_017969 [Sarcophilus harrisii]